MGLLDDAIREHLDLKRRRGADPAEVERAEREALGPVRRNRDPGDTADPEEQVPATGGFAYDQDDDQDWHAADPADLADPHGEFDENEPRLDPVVPAAPAGERNSVRPRSLSEPLDYEAPAPADEAPRFAGEAPPYAEDAPPYADEATPYPEAPLPADEAPRHDAGATPGSWTAADDHEAFSDEPFPTAPGSPRRPADVTGEETTEYRIEHEAEHEDGPGDDMLEETPEFLQDTPDHDRLWFEQRPPRDFDFDG